MFQDPAHKYTDKQLKSVEDHIKGLYTKAYKEIKDDIDKVVSKLNITPDMSPSQRLVLMNKKDRLEMLASQINDTITNAGDMAQKVLEKSAVNIYKTNYNFEADKFKFAVIDNTAALKIMNGKNTGIFSKLKFEEDKPKPLYQLRNALATSLLKGESIRDIAHRIKTITEKSMADSIRIARTETTRAQNMARYDVGKHGEELGFEMLKEWVATSDDRTRDAHNEADGQQVPIDQPFIVGGEKLMYPADISMGASAWNTINCRCTMVNVMSNKNAQIEKLEAQKIDLKKQKAKLDKKMSKENKTYSGIWQDEVTLKDWAEKSDYYGLQAESSIDKKKEYYNEKLTEWQTKLEANPEDVFCQGKVDKYESYLQQLDEFDKEGKKYFDLVQQSEKLNQDLKEVDKQLSKLKPQDDPFTQERKDNALWFTDKAKADKAYREDFGEVWRNATYGEKYAITDYTGGFSKFNEPLRGIEYGTQKYIGVGKIDLNNVGTSGYASYEKGYIKGLIDDMTSIIDKCETKEDMWLNRGVGYRGMDKFFQIDEDLLRYGSADDIMKALEGKVITEYGFMSTSSVKGQGFSGDIKLNIYAPKGSKAAYVEPISHFGNGDGFSWDGISKQRSFGGEFETILQRGSQFRVAKVERSGSRLYIDLDLIGYDTKTNY